MYYTEFWIDGYPFGICDDGVIINPKYMGKQSPEFFESLQRVMLAYPDIHQIEAFLILNQHRDNLREAMILQREWQAKYNLPYIRLATYIDKCLESSPPPPKQPVTHPGYVYLIQSEHGYKIGRSNNPDNRFKAFETKLPFDVELICVHKTDDMIALERRLHDRFADKRLNGEWFDLSEGDVQFIRDMF